MASTNELIIPLNSMFSINVFFFSSAKTEREGRKDGMTEGGKEGGMEGRRKGGWERERDRERENEPLWFCK